MQIRCHSECSEESVRAGGTRSDIRAVPRPQQVASSRFPKRVLTHESASLNVASMKATRFIALAAAFVIVSAVAQSTSDADSKPVEETHKNNKVLNCIPTRAVIAKYIDALGGANAIANVKSRVERGTVTRESGREEPKSSSFQLTLEQPSIVKLDTELSYPPEANQEIVSSFFRAARINELKA